MAREEIKKSRSSCIHQIALGIKCFFVSLTRDEAVNRIEKTIQSSFGFLLKQHSFKIIAREEGPFNSGIIRIENDKLEISFTIDGRDETMSILISKCADYSESIYERSLRNSFNISVLINILEELGHSMKGIVKEKDISKGSYDRKEEVPFERYVPFFKAYIEVLYEYFTTEKFAVLLDKKINIMGYTRRIR